MRHMLLRLGRLYAVSPGFLSLASLCTMLAAGMGLAIPWILKVVIDYGLQQRPGFFMVAGGLVLGATILRGVFTYGYSYLAAALAQQLAHRLRHLLYDHLQRLSFAYHDRAQTGDLMSRATADVEAVRMFFHFGLPNACSMVFTGVGTTVAMAWLDWRLALITLGSLPLFGVVAWWIGHVLRPLQQRVQELTGALTVVLQESLSGIRVVKTFAREDAQTQAFLELAETRYQTYLHVAHTQAVHLPLLTLVMALAIALTLLFGGQQVIAGSLSFGTLVAATGYLAQLHQPLRRLSWISGMASRCQAGGIRLFEVLDAVPTVQEVPMAFPLPPLRGQIGFHQVSFQYDPAMPVLRDISFTVQPGQMIALFGGVGSGKTTIAQLLPRFYDVTGGAITVDGQDIRKVQLASLRRQIGIVMQDAVLFSTTIRDNIAYGCDALEPDVVVAAAKAAHAHDFIMQFPDGYDTWIGERGVTLSGGQRQRIAIARALARNPRILILDDATSSVDMETEWGIQQALATLMMGRTSLVIAQRLRTLKQADMILVLESGRIVQRGTHAALLAQPGFYRRMYDLQLRDQEVTLAASAGENGHADLLQSAPDSVRPQGLPS